jgi:hypothetical protein
VTAKNVDGTEIDEDLRRMFRATPDFFGITSQLFSWVVTKGEAGRAFFLEQQCDPEYFIKQADLDFAATLSQLPEWEAVKILYRPDNMDAD